MLAEVRTGSDHDEAPASASGRISFFQIREPLPAVMLVRIEPGEEPRELGLEQLPVNVLRVRHPMPACHRMGITRPLVVIAGESVCEKDRDLLIKHAREIGAALLLLAPLVDRLALGPWLRRTLETVATRRAASAETAESAPPSEARP